jgi:hypothetical protein
MPVMATHYASLRSKHDFTWGGRSLLLYFTSSSLLRFYNAMAKKKSCETSSA